MGTLENSEEPDEMQHNAHFIRVCTVCHDLKNLQGTEIHKKNTYLKQYRFKSARVITGTFGQWGIFGHFSFSFQKEMRFSDINQALIIQNNQ